MESLSTLTEALLASAGNGRPQVERLLRQCQAGIDHLVGSYGSNPSDTRVIAKIGESVDSITKNVDKACSVVESSLTGTEIKVENEKESDGDKEDDNNNNNKEDNLERKMSKTAKQMSPIQRVEKVLFALIKIVLQVESGVFDSIPSEAEGAIELLIEEDLSELSVKKKIILVLTSVDRLSSEWGGVSVGRVVEYSLKLAELLEKEEAERDKIAEAAKLLLENLWWSQRSLPSQNTASSISSYKNLLAENGDSGEEFVAPFFEQKNLLDITNHIIQTAIPDTSTLDDIMADAKADGTYLGETLEHLLLEYKLGCTAMIKDKVEVVGNEMKEKLFVEKMKNLLSNEGVTGDSMLKELRYFTFLADDFGNYEMTPEGFDKMKKTIVEILERTFDQYTGVRQIYDFRSVPELSQDVKKFGVKANDTLLGHAVLLGLLMLGSAVQGTMKAEDAVATMRELSSKIMSEFRSLKRAILARFNYKSSLTEKITEDGKEEPFNFVIVRQYVMEVLRRCDGVVRMMIASYNAEMLDLLSFGESKMDLVLAKFGGREEVRKKSKGYLLAVKPWALHCLYTQTQSIMQREVFGHTRKDVLDVLYKSQKQMIEGFVGLLANRIPEPFFLFDKLVEDIVSERERLIPPRKDNKKKKKMTRVQKKRLEKTIREETRKGEKIKLDDTAINDMLFASGMKAEDILRKKEEAEEADKRFKSPRRKIKSPRPKKNTPKGRKTKNTPKKGKEENKEKTDGKDEKTKGGSRRAKKERGKKKEEAAEEVDFIKL